MCAHTLLPINTCRHLLLHTPTFRDLPPNIPLCHQHVCLQPLILRIAPTPRCTHSPKQRCRGRSFPGWLLYQGDFTSLPYTTMVLEAGCVSSQELLGLKLIISCCCGAFFLFFFFLVGSFLLCYEHSLFFLSPAIYIFLLFGKWIWATHRSVFLNSLSSIIFHFIYVLLNTIPSIAGTT